MAELAALLEFQDRWPLKPAMYITTMDITISALPSGIAAYVIGECDRHQPVKAFKTLVKSFLVIRRERPDVIITTGSLPLALFSLVCKVFGAKLVWIDSISQINQISMSGRLIRPFADLFFVQWPDLAKHYSNVRYDGELI